MIALLRRDGSAEGGRRVDELLANCPVRIVDVAPGDEPALIVEPAGVGLLVAGRRHPLRVDFADPALIRRCRAGGRDPLLRALRAHRPGSRIIDASAGWGVDTFVLASAGAHVVAIERSPVMFALLEDGMRRGRGNPDTARVLERIELRPGDARRWLPSARWSAAYFDPMFRQPSRAARRGSLVVLEDLTAGCNEDDADVLAAALDHAARVVVKRPVRAPAVGGRQPDWQISGRAIRFDGYLGSTHPAVAHDSGAGS